MLKKAHSSRCFKLDNQHTQKNLWNFWSALDFSATVLTTIGTSVYVYASFVLYVFENLKSSFVFEHMFELTLFTIDVKIADSVNCRLREYVTSNNCWEVDLHILLSSG